MSGIYLHSLLLGGGREQLPIDNNTPQTEYQLVDIVVSLAVKLYSLTHLGVIFTDTQTKI